MLNIRSMSLGFVIALGAATIASAQNTFFGTVRASEIVSLSYSARGCITAIDQTAKRTRFVEAGQLLIELDDQRTQLALRTAEARVADLTAAIAERELAVVAARADEVRRKEELAFADKEFQRNSVMQGRGLINETTMETIERRFMDARFTAERAIEAIANAEAAMIRAELALEIGKLDVQAAVLDVADLAISAPFDGVLVGFEASVGDCVQDGAAAASIYKPQEKSVDVFFPISRLSAPGSDALAIGSEVNVTRVNGESCGGTITRIDTQADAETQFVEATVVVAEDCAPSLFLNEAVEIEPMPVGSDDA